MLWFYKLLQAPPELVHVFDLKAPRSMPWLPSISREKEIYLLGFQITSFSPQKGYLSSKTPKSP